MSLTDGLLLDPQKLDVWIALRTDSVKGSGTESDPFDGTPPIQPAKRRSTLEAQATGIWKATSSR